MYFYGVLSCFGIWDFVHFSAGKRDFNANLGGKQDFEGPKLAVRDIGGKPPKR